MKKKVFAVCLAVLTIVSLLPLATAEAISPYANDNQIDILVEKIWEHGANTEINRPNSVTITLMNGDTQVQSIILTVGNADPSNANKWIGIFENVPCFGDDGNVIAYTVNEVTVSGYASSVTQQPASAYLSLSNWSEKITPASNSVYQIGNATILVSKAGGDYYIWTEKPLTPAQQVELRDAVNAANLGGLGKTLDSDNTEFQSALPATFTITQGSNSNTVTIEAGENGGSQVVFSATSVWSMFYSGTLSVMEKQDAIITNILNTGVSTEHSSFTINKTDGANTLEGASFGLFDNAACTGDPVASYSAGSATVSTADPALASHLPAGGSTATLYLKETAAPDNYTGVDTVWPVVIGATVGVPQLIDNVYITNTTYTITVDGEAKLTVINNAIDQPATGTLTISKKIEGNAAVASDQFEFIVTLFQNEAPLNGEFSYSGTLDGTTAISGAVSSGGTIALKGGGSATITEIPVGTEYSVLESDSNGYSVTSTGEQGIIMANGAAAAFTNTKEKPVVDDGIDITVNKVWQDSGGSKRPTQVLAQLYRDGSAYGDPVILNADNDWTYTWRDLNDTYIWSVDELNVPADYEKTVTGSDTSFTIINTRITPDDPDDGTTYLTVDKVWRDGGSSRRPTQILVQLYRDGSAYGDPVILSADNDWTYTWRDLNDTYIWSVDELNVPADYTKTLYGSGVSYTIVNSRPIDNVPKTGDESNTGLLTTLIALSFIGMGVTGWLINRSRPRKIRQK